MSRALHLNGYLQSSKQARGQVDNEGWLAVIKNALPWLPWIGGFGSFVFGVVQWRAQRSDELRWKQKEAFLKHLHSFNESPGAHNALMMLGAESREVPLWDDDERAKRYVRVSREDVVTALNKEDDHLSPKESAIRDSFNDLFSKLSQIQYYRNSKLLDDSDVAFYVRTWAFRLTHESEPGNSILRYIVRHRLDAVADLLRETAHVQIERAVDIGPGRVEASKLRLGDQPTYDRADSADS